MLALAPIVPILAGLVLAAGGVGVWWFTAGRRKELQPGKPAGQLPAADDPNVPPGAPAELVDSLTGTYTDGAFHQTQSGDSINGLVTKTLNKISPGRGNEPAMIKALRVLLNRSSFNQTLFGEEIAGDAYAVDGQAINRFALPKHEDTIAVMRLGFLPERNIDDNGNRIGPSQKWGDPWVPALNHDAVKAGVSDPDLLLSQPWEDGTPATEPPPELFAVLEERA